MQEIWAAKTFKMLSFLFASIFTTAGPIHSMNEQVQCVLLWCFCMILLVFDVCAVSLEDCTGCTNNFDTPCTSVSFQWLIACCPWLELSALSIFYLFPKKSWLSSRSTPLTTHSIHILYFLTQTFFCSVLPLHCCVALPYVVFWDSSDSKSVNYLVCFENCYLQQ